MSPCLIIGSIYVLKTTANLRSMYYEEKEMQDIMKNGYQKKEI